MAFYDNVKHVPSWLSDEACKAVTGIGQTRCKLYTDDDDILYEYKRCLGFNGINLNLTEPDALDRTAYIDEMVFKRIAELEDNQTILRNIIDNNEDNPEAQIKAVAELNETTILISQLFEMLPSITSLGVDAFQQTIQTQIQTGKNDNSSSITITSGSGSRQGRSSNAGDYIEWCKKNNPKHPDSRDCRWQEYQV